MKEADRREVKQCVLIPQKRIYYNIKEVVHSVIRAKELNNITSMAGLIMGKHQIVRCLNVPIKLKVHHIYKIFSRHRSLINDEENTLITAK